MDNVITIDNNDCQTSSNEQNSSDDISSTATEDSIPIYTSNIGNIRVCRVKVTNRNSLPNLKIKHPYYSDNNENDLFNDEQRIINDEHVKISRIKRSSLRSLNIEISHLSLDARSRRKSTSNVSVSHANKRLSQSVNQIRSRQSTVRVNRMSTTPSKNREKVASKPVVARLSPLPSELLFKKSQRKLHVSVKHISVNPKRST